MNETLQLLRDSRQPEGAAGLAAPFGSASLPPVLDACCSTRMMWFDKQDSRALYVDKREGTRIIDVGTPGTIGRTPKTVAPDMLADFRSLPFPDESFWHVVFDPPHFHKGAGATGRIAFDFGLLDATWRDDLRAGFTECFRVLKPMGTLIFKWCEAEIPLREVLALTPERPLYGHRSGKKAQTHWCAFLKPNSEYPTAVRVSETPDPVSGSETKL